ncbi:MAG: hypothetical protein LBE12_15655 [Planctomycetaceae bacterium]|jgi:hypothetical protein|nr:hypothetical protein [Planctomycetaceae bacterium]
MPEAKKIFDAVDRSVPVIKWKCRIEHGHPLIDITSVPPQKDNYYEEYVVLYDLKSKRFIVDGEICVPWIDGSVPTIKKELGYSFDGKKYAYWERKFDDKGNRELAGFASISLDMTQVEYVKDFIVSNGSRTGFGAGFPGWVTLTKKDFHGAIRISDLLAEWDSRHSLVTLRTTSMGKLEIEGIITWDNGTDRHVNLMCELSNNAIVSKSVRFSRFQNKDYIGKEYLVEFIKNGQGKFVPKIVRACYPLDKRMTILYFSDIEFDPKVNEQSFQLQIPNGTYVTDHITKKYYKVGDIVDEDKAISDFMTRYNLTGNVPAQSKVASIVRYSLITIGGLMILISLFLIIRKRWLKL